MRYRVTVPNWYSGVITTEMVDGKEIVIQTTMSPWSVGKDIREVSAYYRARTDGTVEPIGGKKKIIRRKRRTIKIIRRKK